MYEDILKRLQAGESMDDIAEDLTAQMNKAKSEYEAEQAKIQKEKEIADKRMELRSNTAEMIWDMIAAYYEEAHPEFYAKHIADLETDDCVDAIDEVLDEVPEWINGFSFLTARNARIPVRISTHFTSPTPTPTDKVNKFLKDFGLF